MMNQLPSPERPRERCLRQGPQCLSLRECLAILIGSGPPGVGSLGVAASILSRPGSDLNPEEEEIAFFTAMEVSADAHLSGIRGIGTAAKARLLAAFEIGRRYSCARESRHRTTTTRSQSLHDEAIARIPFEWRTRAQEWLGFVPLRRPESLGNLCIVERGARTHVNVDPAELFARVLAFRPSGFFLFHNHPSGSLHPSEADRELTRHVSRVSVQLGIPLLGHAIITSRGESWIVI